MLLFAFLELCDKELVKAKELSDAIDTKEIDNILTLRLAVKKDALFHYNINSFAGTRYAISILKTSLFLLICSILVRLSMAFLFYTHTSKYVLIIIITQQ